MRLRVCNVVINLVSKRVGLGKHDTEQTDEQRDWPRESRKRSREMTWSTSASSLSHPSTRSAMQNTSLADELMNDMDDFDSDEEEPVAGPSGAGGQDDDADMDEGADGEVTEEMRLPSGGIKPAEELDPAAVNTMELGAVSEVSRVAKLAGSKVMREVLSVSSAGAVEQQGGS